MKLGNRFIVTGVVTVLGVSALSAYAALPLVVGKGHSVYQSPKVNESGSKGSGVGSAAGENKADEMSDITIAVPMRQHDFAVLSERWRMALARDFSAGGVTLRPKGCASYSRVVKNDAFPAQCYEVLYRGSDGVHLIMPVTSPMIALKNARYAGNRIMADVTYAQCSPQGGCALREPVTLTMNPDYYRTLRGLMLAVAA